MTDPDLTLYLQREAAWYYEQGRDVRDLFRRILYQTLAACLSLQARTRMGVEHHGT